jgi:hypothetical protein
MGELSSRIFEFCLITRTEVDLLYQLPFYWSRWHTSHPVPESQTCTELVG